jgi:hypothetical protein
LPTIQKIVVQTAEQGVIVTLAEEIVVAVAARNCIRDCTAAQNVIEKRAG